MAPFLAQGLHQQQPASTLGVWSGIGQDRRTRVVVANFDDYVTGLLPKRQRYALCCLDVRRSVGRFGWRS